MKASLFPQLRFLWLLALVFTFTGWQATQAAIKVSSTMTQVSSARQYSLSLTNLSTAGETVNTFWFAWVPGQNYLPLQPYAITVPTGWTAEVTHGGSSDGYGIKFTTSTDPLPSGTTLIGFSFRTDSPLVDLQGNSSLYPGTPVTTSEVFTSGGSLTFVAFVAQTDVILHNFGDGTVTEDGLVPQAGLVQGTDGNFYGTTDRGGSTYLSPGDPGSGTVFRITPAGSVTILHSFLDGSVVQDGASPTAPLIQGTDGNFYGTAPSGGIAFGTIFKMTPGGVVTIMHKFGDGSTVLDGGRPGAPLVQGTDGNFYGTAPLGGKDGYGTAFKMTPAGILTTLHSFLNDGKDGRYPQSGLVQGPNGAFYGTTNQGGTAGYGTIYKMTPSGSVTILHNFADGSVPGDGYGPGGQNMIVGSDGNLYGTTASDFLGGEYAGVVYKITPTGTYSILHHFVYGAADDAGRSFSPLVKDSSGVMYGVSFGGGVEGNGTVFRINLAGEVSVLHSFPSENQGKDGANPVGGVIVGKDGNIYGTTIHGGTAQYGVVFRVVPPKLQTITFPAIGSLSSGTILPLGATATSGLPVGYTIVSGPATVSGNKLTVNGTGTVKITASQAGDGIYAAATSVTQSFSVTKTAQTITFPALGSQPYGILFPPGATASSGLPVTYSIVSGPATISGNKVSFTGVGKVVVQGSQIGNSTYAAAPVVTATVTAIRGPQTITLPKVPNQVVGAGSITLQGTASSGLPVTYKVTGPATVSGNVVTITGAGSVGVGAYQSGNTVYAAAPNVQIKFTVSKLTQTITFPAVGAVTVGQTVTLGATSSSGLAVTYAVTSGPATVSGNKVTFTGKGTVKLTATQLGDATYAAARAVAVNVSVK